MEAHEKNPRNPADERPWGGTGHRMQEERPIWDRLSHELFLARVRDVVLLDFYSDSIPSVGESKTEGHSIDPGAPEPGAEPQHGQGQGVHAAASTSQDVAPTLFSGTPWEHAIGGPQAIRILAHTRWGTKEKNELRVRYIKAVRTYTVSYNGHSVTYHQHEIAQMHKDILRVFDVSKLKRCDKTTLKELEALGIISRERHADKVSKKKPLPARSERVGFSEIATVMGVNKWESPFGLWLRKTGQVPEKEERLTMTWGRLTEKTLFSLWWERRFGTKCPTLTTGVSYQRPAIASEDLAGVIDFLVYDPNTGERVVVETKVSNLPEVTESYRLQINAQLGAMGLRRGYIVVMVGAGREIITEEVEFDPDLYQKQLEAARHFMWCVREKVPPIPEGVHAENAPDGSKAGKVEADSEFAKEVEQLLKIEDQYDAIVEEREKLRDRVKEYMTQLQLNTLFFGEVALKLRIVEGERLDTKLLKKERPDVAQQYIKKYSYESLKIEK